MTPHNETPQDSGSTESNAASSSTPPAKAPRRRVTRVAAAPTVQPVAFLTADPIAASGQASSEPATPAPASQAAPVAQEPATPPARRSRRATSAAGAPKAQKESPVIIAEDAKAKTSQPESAPTLPILDLPEPKADKPARSRKSAPRTEREPAAELDVFAEVSALAAKKRTPAKESEAVAPATNTTAVDQLVNLDAVAQDHEAQVSKGAKTRNQRSGSKAKATAKTAPKDSAPQDVSDVEAPKEPKEEPVQKAPAEKQASSRRTRARANQVFMDPRAQEPERSAPAPQKPRLATTALLFQAPDLNAAAAQQAALPASTPAPVVAEEETEVETVTSSPRSNQRGGRKSTRKPRVEVVVEEPEVEADSEEQSAPETSPSTDAAGTGPKNDDQTAEVPEGSEENDSSDSDDSDDSAPRRRRRRGGRGRRNRSSSDNGDNDDSDSDSDDDDSSDSSDEEAEDQDAKESKGSKGSQKSKGADAESDTDGSDESEDGEESDDDNGEDDEEYSSSRRRRRRRRGTRTGDEDSSPSTRARPRSANDEVTALKGSTRLEAKRQRRRDGRDAGRRRTIITEAEFLARRESVERSMIVRERDDRTQIAVLEDGVLVEHYVSQQQQASMAGNVYLGRVQNVLPSMEAAFIDVGKGRNAVLYAGEVNWDASGLDGQPRRIESALKSGDQVLVQVTKDPIGHKGARLTSQVTLAGRYLVFVPGGGMTGISRKLPDTERARLKRILKEIVPDGAGVIVRTAAEGASEEELTSDVARLQTQWDAIQKKAKTASAPSLLQGEPDLAIRVVRDIFNDDFSSLQVQGNQVWDEISQYVQELAPDLADRVTHWVSEKDIFAQARVDEQLAKGMDRKVWLPSGGSLVIDRTEAMTVIDVNTGKFTGAGGTLEETVTRNNLESAEEVVRQLRLRDIGGIIVIDFIDMVLESNRDLVLRRLVECLGRDRTKHQVAEVTSLGLVQMTRKRVGQGLVEAFSTTCEHCNGRGFIVHDEPNERQGAQGAQSVPHHEAHEPKRSKRKRSQKESADSHSDNVVPAAQEADSDTQEAVKATLDSIAAAATTTHAESAAAGNHTQEGATQPAGDLTDGAQDGAQTSGDSEGAPEGDSAKPARKNGRAPRKNGARSGSKPRAKAAKAVDGEQTADQGSDQAPGQGSAAQESASTDSSAEPSGE